MPKLWSATIEEHRRDVRDAVLDAAAALVAKHGVLSVTMSQVAEETGIGRATLYKYFPDVEAILLGWHERHVAGHLGELEELARKGGAPPARLEAMLEAYALIQFEHHAGELEAVLHRGEHVARAKHQLSELLRALLVEGAQAGDLRKDVPAEELATYCLHAAGGASALSSKAAVRRLVNVIMAGLRKR